MTAMPPIQKRYYTPEDLLMMPDDGKSYELVNGVLKERPMSGKSTYTAGLIHNLLFNFVQPRKLGYVYPEGNTYCCFSHDPKMVRKADTSFITIERMPAKDFHKKGLLTIAPDLVVEVTSPTNSADEVDEKVVDWLKAGVKIVWQLYPNTGRVYIFRPDFEPSIIQIGEELTAEDILPGFKCNTSKLFDFPPIDEE